MKILSALVAGTLVGCATTNTPDDSGKPKVVAPAFYTLKEGSKMVNKAPLPNKTEIMVNWTYTDGSKKSKEGFRGWDLDHDGRFDMLEVLGPDGEHQMWAYDFDGDGVIDAVDKSKMEQNLTADATDVSISQNAGMNGPVEAPKNKPAPPATEDMSTSVKPELKTDLKQADVKEDLKADQKATESLKTPPEEPKKRTLLKPADAPKERTTEKALEDLKAELRERMSPDADKSAH